MIKQNIAHISFCKVTFYSSFHKRPPRWSNPSSETIPHQIAVPRAVVVSTLHQFLKCWEGMVGKHFYTASRSTTTTAIPNNSYVKGPSGYGHKFR